MLLIVELRGLLRRSVERTARWGSQKSSLETCSRLMGRMLVVNRRKPDLNCKSTVLDNPRLKANAQALTVQRCLPMPSSNAIGDE